MFYNLLYPLADALAALGDLFVNDAFSAAHRAHASTEGLARLLPAYPGLAMQRELEMLDAALGKPQKPVIGIVGGSKVSTKLDLLGNLVTKVDHLVIGGGMANTFLVAQGVEVGKSLAERDMADTAREIMGKAEKPYAGLRVGVKNGGCAGQEYVLEYAESAGPLDEVVEDKGVRILIEPKAVLFLLGSTIDFESDALSAKFVFRNPNETDACGCGESVTIVPAQAAE